MKKISVVVLLFFAILLPAGNVKAGPDAFDRADVNKDGYIMEYEFKSYITSRLKEYDTNKDGKIDANEFGAKKSPEAVKEFGFMDKNNDGVVNAEEFYRAALQRRDQIDFSRDGKISREEYNSNKTLPFLQFYF